MMRQEAQGFPVAPDDRNPRIFTNQTNGLREIRAQQGAVKRRLRDGHGAPERRIGGRDKARVEGLDVQHSHLS